MVCLKPEVSDSLFRHAQDDNWIGPVQVLFAGRECVPMMVDSARIFVELTSPPFVRGFGVFEDMLFKCQDGTIFYPRLEYRMINIWYEDTASEERMRLICEALRQGRITNRQNFAEMLARAISSYYEVYPHVGQYFFQSEDEFSSYFASCVQRTLNMSGNELTTISLSDLAAPYYGFVINANKGA